MGRNLGILNIPGNFEPQFAAPFDARTVVDTYADLMEPDTFISIDGNSYAYLGLVVSVIADPNSNNNGVYLLKAFPTTVEENWQSLSGGITGVIPEYADTIEYLIGDVISFISPNADILEEGNPLKDYGLYECLEDTIAGENPETAPNKWRYLGKIGETSGNTLITDIIGLQSELNTRVRYTDIADNLKTGPDNKVKLDVSYLTVSDYSPSEDIQPGSGEVQLGNIIWKTSNEIWTDSGTGIVVPKLSNSIEADIQIYGYLYNSEAIVRLLEANPGYRLATDSEFLESLSSYWQPVINVPNVVDICHSDYWQTEMNTGWETEKGLITNSSGLSLVSSGLYLATASPSLQWKYSGTFLGFNYWLQEGKRFRLSTYINEFGAMQYVVIPVQNSILYSSDPNSPYYNTYMAVRLVKDI